MGAGAPYGNKNAEKWKLPESKELFERAIELANQKEEINGKETYSFDFIGEVARELKYYKSIFTELKNKFPELEPLHTQLVETLEANCYCNSKKGNIREATAIVNLKSNHHWTDRNNTTLDGELNVFSSPEFKRKSEDRLNKADDSG